MPEQFQPNYSIRYLIIDDDNAILSYIADILNPVNPLEIHTCVNPSIGWETAIAKDFDFLIIDWKMQPIDGACLLNRFRSHEKYKRIPILVISGYLNKSDMSLLEEFSLIGKQEKPIPNQIFLYKIAELLKIQHWQKKQKVLVDKIFNESIDKKTLLVGLAKHISKSPRPVDTALEISKLIGRSKSMALSKQILLRSLKNSPRSIRLLSEIGKVSLLQGDIIEAKKYLLTAHKYSPTNVERLCDLGSIHLQDQQFDQANRFFDKALSIDGENEKATSGQKITENVREFISKHQEIPKTFASLLNAIGISMAKSKEFEKAKNHYQDAMKYVSDRESMAKLSYNLGLCFTKWGKDDQAKGWFEKCLQIDPAMEKAKKKLDGMPVAEKIKRV